MLGIHCSVSGGLENAFEEAVEKKADTFQIFTRNQRQWNAKPVSDDEKEKFRSAWKKSGVGLVFSHTSYLINLAAEKTDVREKSVNALTEEVRRCTDLGLAYCVLHPGAAGNQSLEASIQKIADGLKQVIRATHGSRVIILLENTAGQGTSVGGEFENLKEIYDLTGSKRIGYCFDTCHAFAAGYDIREKQGVIDVFGKFDEILGLENLKVFHLNDSKGDLGSHLDRHENIGKGKIGKEAFRYIMQNFPKIPKVIETPKEGNWDEVNLKTLRDLV